MSAAIPALCERAGIDLPAAEAADEITALCDMVSFDVCVERPEQGELTVAGEPVRYTVDGRGGVTLAPWPLGLPWLDLLLVGFRADGYPSRLDRVADPIRLRPA
jgi:hypothetical protein